MKKKYYVVWKGKKRGIYNSWEECKSMISGVKNAQFKSFTNLTEAQQAFKQSYWAHLQQSKAQTEQKDKFLNEAINWNSISVDAASSGNPGIMEYRGVDTKTKKVLFHQGPFELGTNNIGEFLAIVHGLAFLHNIKSDKVLYTDSQIAIGWVRKRKCKTTLPLNKKTEKLFELISRAEEWLKNTNYKTPVLKWETSAWGEIPADFGRK